MKLSSLQIKNFRCFKDQTIYFDQYCCLVGANGSGKSTVLMALNVFFRNTEVSSISAHLCIDDFFDRDTKIPIEIIATFEKLTAEAKSDFKAYVRQEKLIITSRAEWDNSTQSAEVKQVGSRLVMQDFIPYFRCVEENGKSPELKEIFSELRKKFPDLNHASSMDAMRDALRAYEEEHPELCEPFESLTNFYGWSKGSNLLGKYIQWIYIPAIKDPTEEQDEQKNSALGKLLQRTVRSEVDFTEAVADLKNESLVQYQQILEAQNAALITVASALQEKLRVWANPNAKVELNWHFDQAKSVTISDPHARAFLGEGNFLGDVGRAGHGFQRSFLVALLQVLATQSSEDAPNLLLGFEEPELFQHPPQARHLQVVLEDLANGGGQVILTTHSPYFVSSHGYESVRLFQISSGQSAARISSTNYEYLTNTLAEALSEEPATRSTFISRIEQIMLPSQNEMFFTRIPVLVEGPEDIAVISAWLRFNDLWDEFRRLGCHFISTGGKTNLSRPLAIANLLELPAYIIFDGDCTKVDQMSTKERNALEKTNACILKLLNEDIPPIIDQCQFGNRWVMWRNNILDSIIDDITEEVWVQRETEARISLDMESGVKRKNPLLVAGTMDKVLHSGIAISKLQELGQSLFAFAKATNGEKA